MTASMLIVLGLLGLSLVLFSLEKLSIDLVTLSLLILLVITGILTPQEAFSGFSNEIIIILASIFVIGGAFQETRFLEGLSARLVRDATYGPKRLLALIMGGTAAISSFMNNTTATAMLVPAVTGLVRRLGLSPSRFLMPLAFASMLGGTCTLIGTSTNVAVSGYLAKVGLAPVGLFEITPMGIILLGVGILYMIVIGCRLLPDHPSVIEETLPPSEMFELLVTPHSDLTGRTLAETSFRQRYGFHVLAIHRAGSPVEPVSDGTRLQVGDVLLVQGSVRKAELLTQNMELSVMGESAPTSYDMRAGRRAAIIFALSVLIGVTGWAPLSIAFLAGAVAMIFAKCLTVERAYQYIDWRLVILIGGMTAFGVAMEKTGAAQLLGAGLANLLVPWGPRAVLAGFFLLTIILTQPMSNAAAALVVLPVALSAAGEIGADPRAFGIGVMLSASISFIAPFEPSCVLVYSAGNYRFRDFIKVGVGLTVLLSGIAWWLLPSFWPLH